MAVPSKRKASPEEPAPHVDANDLLRRHFESRFLPIVDESAGREPVHRGHDSPARQEEGDDDDEWSGLSDEDDAGGRGHDDGDSLDGAARGEEATPEIEIVDHSRPHIPKEPAMTKRELKAFMSSRPPSSDQTSQPPPNAKPSPPLLHPEDAPSLLKQDLELRRLLAESHLLAPHAATKSLSSVSSNPAQTRTFDTGRTRSKTTDLRVQALGSKLSIHKQDRMPMHMRKGMVAAAGAREAKRRREARENGIILEREAGKKRKTRERDARGAGGAGGRLDRPGVGRLKGAELRISERDVRSIEGTRDTFGRRGNRR